VLYANPAAQRVIGRPLDQILGKSDLDWAIDRAQAEQIIAHDREVIDTGETLDTDEIFTDPSGKTTYFRSVKAPLRNASGEIIGLVGITSDMTKRREVEERERLLAKEIDHRAKNLLAVVQSVVQLTRAEDADALKRSVSGRIQSLARAHSLLAAGRWEGVDLRQLITEELAAYAGRELGRVTVEGPTLQLRPTAAQALGMIVHELATNAMKYGSLSAPEGRLAVRWALERGDGQQQLRLTWAETGGPLTTAPTRKGFGTTVIRTSVERQLHGRLAVGWHQAGLHCEMLFPAAQLIPSQPGEAPQRAEPSRAAERRGSRLAGCRVLLVEDEALIGLQMEEALREAGCEPLGPAATILEALDIINRDPVDAALLDVNLAGGRSYAVADVLTAKGVPFAFCTGYSSPADLPTRFADATLITKPLRPEQIGELLDRLAEERSDVCG
jgi:PAS domain S-box-containing protein